MVFKKPYAFFIKYFRLINLILCFLFGNIFYKLNLLRVVINDIYLGKVTNYSNLGSSYIGFKMYLLLFIILSILIIIILLLKRKEKPLKDYLFASIYIFVLFLYLMAISSLFLTLDETIVEQTSLKLYTDIALLIIVPIIYFAFKFILIVIGFNLNKFNFTKDIMELKQEEKDNEEIEIIFDKNSYKYKRNFRRGLREFKYYLLENKLLIGIIVFIILLVLSISLFTVNIFNSNNVNVGESFNAANFTYRINNVYETNYSLNYTNISKDFKFVVVSVNARNNIQESRSIDFKRIRLIYDDEYVYANNYFNKFFYDIGVPYNNEVLKSGESYNYIFIFKVPISYKSNKYVLKFYDKITYENKESKGSYKEIEVNAKNLDKKRELKELNLKENIVFNKKNYGNSNLTLSNYEIKSIYVYNKDGKSNIVKNDNINKILLILDYKLYIDENYNISDYFKNAKEFFDKFISISYSYNGKDKVYNDVRALADVDNKIILSVPYEVQDSSNLKVNINFRDTKISYKLN